MSRTELDAFLDAYKAQYLAPSKSTLVDTLLDSGLMRSEGEYFTVYRYVGGYFAGRYIAEALAGKAFDAAQKRLTFLADNAHNDDCALVLLFVCHHTKNPAVLETILLNTMVALDGSPTSLFEREEFEAIGEMLGQIPRATIYAEPLDDSIERKLELQDARDAVASELDDASPSLGPNEEIAKFLRAMKAIEITGQLVRNRHGSLDVLQISELVEQAISCAQRIAGFVIDLSTQLKDMLPGMVSEMQQRHPGRTKDRLEAELRRFVNFCCHFSLHGLMSNVSQQLCNDALKGLVLDKLSARDDYFARLLYVHVRLKLEDHSVIHDIQRTIVQFEKNAFVLNLLQHAVADRVQLFDIPFDDKQRIAEMFKIDVPTQVAMHKPIYGRR